MHPPFRVTRPEPLELDGRRFGLGDVEHHLGQRRRRHATEGQEPDEGSEVELGWMLIRDHWGHGYAAEAALALLDWTDRRRLVSLIQHGNERSVRVAEKLGERYERDVEVRGVPTRLFSLER